MATVIHAVDRPPAEPALRAFTTADLAAMPQQLPSGQVDYELDNGRFIAMSPPGRRHASIQARIVNALIEQGEQAGHGTALGDVGVVLWRRPDRVVGPDAAFVARARFPIRESPEGYLETIPDLVVEVRSKNDTPEYLSRKVDDYLAAGVRLVLIVEEPSQSVIAHRANQPPHIFAAADTIRLDVLDAGDVIPGFHFPVGGLFAE